MCLEFQGEWADSYIDGKKMRYFPSNTRKLRIVQGLFPVFAMVLIAISIVALIYAVRYTIQPSIGFVWGQTFASATNTIQIQIMNSIFSKMAKWLTDRENYRTDTQVDTS